MHRYFVVIATVLLCACGYEGASSDLAAVETAARMLEPADAELASIYNRSCRACHTVAATGAPLAGDQAAWGELMAKGPDVLLENVVAGYGGMPPFGLCMDCDADEFDALIAFMARGR
ncbi:MAG: c-type cytochrome [Pseudomonadota bacterium]